MASTYSTNLKLQLMTTGENSTTWGTVTNTNLGTAIEEAIAGSADVTFSSGNETISLSNSNATQTARHMRLNLTGTTGGSTRTLTVPDIEKAYIVNNGCADAVEVKNSTGSNVSVPAGKSMWVYSTGSAVVDAVTSLTSLTVGGSDVVTLSATQTLTDKTLTAPTINDGALGANTTATTQSTGDNTTKVATTEFVTSALTTSIPSGVIVMWSGAISAIPSGWVICDGTNSTPDLSSRFVIHADADSGGTYNVGDTGGSADATLVSHTHTIGETAIDGAIIGISEPFNGSGSATGVFTKAQGDPVGGTPDGSTDVSNGGRVTLDAAHDHTISTEGSSATNANLPPYYALAYIMKT